MTTLRELLDAGDIEGARAWAYGGERECKGCVDPLHGLHSSPGNTRTPGLVERLGNTTLMDDFTLLAALRQELGEVK